MSALTARLSEDDLRELAALLRRTHARTAARLERERREAREAQHAEANRQSAAEQRETPT
jgi:cytochrome c553